jgi:hypothetical protein
MEPEMYWTGFAVALTTTQGFPLVAGGICKSGTTGYWKGRFLILESLRVGSDACAIDRALACALRDLADETLPIVGCSLDARLSLPPGIRTGGVLGCPHIPAEPARDACELLPQGFSLHTTAGGPGLAALASPEATEGAIAEVQTLRPNVSPGEITRCLLATGLETFLFVADGTGSSARGCLIAAGPDGVTAVDLGNPL